MQHQIQQQQEQQQTQDRTDRVAKRAVKGMLLNSFAEEYDDDDTYTPPRAVCKTGRRKQAAFIFNRPVMLPISEAEIVDQFQMDVPAGSQVVARGPAGAIYPINGIKPTREYTLAICTPVCFYIRPDS